MSPLSPRSRLTLVPEVFELLVAPRTMSAEEAVRFLTIRRSGRRGCIRIPAGVAKAADEGVERFGTGFLGVGSPARPQERRRGAAYPAGGACGCDWIPPGLELLQEFRREESLELDTFVTDEGGSGPGLIAQADIEKLQVALPMWSNCIKSASDGPVHQARYSRSNRLMRFQHRVVIVTGEQGDRRGCVRVFAAEEVPWRFSTSTRGAGRRLADELSASSPGRVRCYGCDVSDGAALAGVIEAVVRDFGRLDSPDQQCRDPSAGDVDRRDGSLRVGRAADADQFPEFVRGAKFAAPHLRKTKGTIVNMSSMTAVLQAGEGRPLTPPRRSAAAQS